MRILFLNYEFPPLGGGASPVSYNIVAGYVKAGHFVSVVTMGFRGLPEYEFLDGVHVYRVPCWRSSKEMCYPWEQLTYILSAKRFLRKHLRTQNYDRVHVNFLVPTGLIGLWLKKQYGLQYIVSSYGSDIPGYNPDRFTFLHRFTGPWLRKILVNSSGAYAASNYLAELGNQISDVKYSVIREGMDPNIFLPMKKEKIILSTGRLLERKGFHYLLQAVHDEDLGVEVHICGDGPMRPSLEKMASTSKTKIIFHGWLNNRSDEYKTLLGRAMIYCLVSKKENASVSLLEAMSAECAVITSNVAGCPESVGGAGVIIPPEDVQALRRALFQLLQNPAQIKKLGSMGRARVLKDYSPTLTHKKYLEALQ